MLSDKFRIAALFGIVFLLGGRLAFAQANEFVTVKSDQPSQKLKASLFRHTVLRPGRISKYDRIIKKYSFRYGFDWRLIASQIHAESRFNAQARSRSGALGLMQIMPGTARHLGKPPKLLLKPEINIALGCLYDRRLYNIWKEEKGKDRVAFMLASYNAGHRRVMRAQKRARKPDKWTSIKRHLPGQTRHYVFKIFKTYETYKKLVF